MIDFSDLYYANIKVVVDDEGLVEFDEFILSDNFG